MALEQRFPNRDPRRLHGGVSGFVPVSRSINVCPGWQKVPGIHFSKIMKLNSSLTMNWTAGDTIAAAIQVMTFFWRRPSFRFWIGNLIIIIESEPGDKSNVTCNWDSQKSRFAKKGPRSKKFGKPCIGALSSVKNINCLYLYSRQYKNPSFSSV